MGGFRIFFIYRDECNNSCIFDSCLIVLYVWYAHREQARFHFHSSIHVPFPVHLYAQFFQFSLFRHLYTRALRTVEWLVGWLVDWLVDWLVVWLVGEKGEGDTERWEREEIGRGR